MGDVYPPAEFPWVKVARDGRVEMAGRVIRVRAELAERAYQLATCVMGLPRTHIDTLVHDPNSKARLEVRYPDGTTEETILLWGRSSRCDLLFYPVDGEEAREVFRAFVDVLRAIRYGEPERQPPPLGEGKNMWDIVQLLVQAPPSRLSRLEQVLGPLSYGSTPEDGAGRLTRPAADAPASAVLSTAVRRVTVQLSEGTESLDDASSVSDPALAQVCIEFPWPRVVIDLLERFCGPGTRFRDSPQGTGTQFGHFVSFDRGDHFVWYAVAPTWPRAGTWDRLRRWVSKRLRN